MNDNNKPYTKPPLSFTAQADILLKRGLIADRSILVEFLQRVNYYRFTTYLYPFRQVGSDHFQANTHFSDVRMLYEFDQALRAMLFDAITTLEIALLRARFVEFFTLRYGAFGYAETRNFKMSAEKHKNLLKNIQEASDRSKEEFIKHFRNTYSEPHLPLWMVVEITSFGDIVTMIEGLQAIDKREFFRPYQIDDTVMISWLRSLNYIRNCCAHHVRLWNRTLAIRPKLPNYKNRPEFHAVKFSETQIFSVMTIIQYLLNIINPSHQWYVEVSGLLARFPDVPIDKMGFPENWHTLPMWQHST
ncbi:MAG: Abi family protein [Anaerolineae bacterium]|jgi:abortive infection bacteriophage resistance protein|nr:Abi family protein [Anaerolineae bacterium]